MSTEHVARQVTRQQLRDDTDDRIRALALKLDLHGDFDPRMYMPPGPVAQAFLNSTALTSVIMGPLGGGKTTTSVFRRLMTATRQPVAIHPEDGIPTRMCRGIVLRDTFRAAERTVLESWKQWFPKTYPGSSSKGGNDRPFEHRLRFRGHDGIRVEAITLFAGLGEDNIETLMKGSEWSFAWLNEIDTHAEGALDDMEQRVGRYPMADTLMSERDLERLAAEKGVDKIVSGGRQRTVIGDMNAPTVDNWTYEELVVNPKPDRVLYQQPSGRSLEAENRTNLEPDYYDRIIANQDERFVKRMVDNQFGFSRAGKPVYEAFDQLRHVANHEIAYRPELDLHIGIDTSTSGLSPAAMIGQASVRISFIDELEIGAGVGPARFGEALKNLMGERYPNHPKNRVKLWFDPAAFGGNDKEADQLDAANIIAQILGAAALIPGNGSNEIALRLKAMENEFRGYLEPNSALLVSRRCKKFIMAAGGKYRFKKRTEAASNLYEDMPEKAHPWSDLADAGQYLVIGVRGHRAVLTGDKSAGKDGRWSSQSGDGPERGFKSQRTGGFDPHKAGAN